MAHELVQRDRQCIWHPYTQQQTAPLPVPVVAAKGAILYTADGREFVDMVSSWWVTTHGHAHPAIADAIAHQAHTLEQVIFSGFTHEPAVQLAEALLRLLPPSMTRVFYSDNGSTAVEVALKMALQYWRNQGQQRPRFLAFEGGYHGDTVGAMSAGRSSGYFGAFQELLFHVDYLPYPMTWEGDTEVEAREQATMQALEVYLDQHGHECAALIVEPLVQGAAGMRLCRPLFLQRLAARLREAGVLLIFDEVMTGFGRTGALFACLKVGVEPDLLCLSKGLSGGFLPLAATVCGEGMYEAFLGERFDRAFAHGHSFTANPLGCAAGVASLRLFDEEQTMEKVAAIEAIHRARLAVLARHPKVRRPRWCGSIAALETTESPEYLSKSSVRLQAFFFSKGLLIRPLGNVLYLLPPYCIAPADLHRAWDGIHEALDQVL